jgi:uncharacterized membrane protein
MSRLGRIFFGAGVIGSGVLQLASGAFIRLVAQSSWRPTHPAVIYGSGVLLVLIGLAILTGRMGRIASAVLAGIILVNLVVLYPPSMFADPRIDRPLLRGFMYTNPLKCLALIGGLTMIAARLPADRNGPRPVRRFASWSRYGPLALAVFLIVAGVQHFWYAGFVVTLVPEYMPARMFWTYFTGVALFAGGVGLLVPRTSRLAATLSGVMIFLWVLMLHIPRAVGLPAHAFEAAGVFEALALSGVAFVVAGTRAHGPGRP